MQEMNKVDNLSLEELEMEKKDLENDLQFVNQQIEKFKHDNSKSDYISDLHKDLVDDLNQLNQINFKISQMANQNDNENSRRVH